MRYGLFCATAVIALAPQVTWAQAPTGAPSAVTDSATEGSDDIIVTANRRSEPLQKVPIAVTAVTGEALAERGVSGPQDLERLVSTVTIQNSGGGQQATNFSIRGVGTSSFQRSAEASVATVLDDVTLIRSDMAIVNFVDVASVEVLNGPQGFLFGKNASAGLVNIRTKEPQIGENSGRLFAEAGWLNNAANTRLVKAQGIVNVATGSDSALRVNLFLADNGDFVKPVNPTRSSASDFGYRQLGFNAKFLWKPTENFELLISGDYADNKGNGAGFANMRSTQPGSPIGLSDGALGIVFGANNSETGADATTNLHSKVWGGQARATLQLGGGYSLTDIMAYRDFRNNTNFDTDYSSLPLGQDFPGTIKARQWSNELRLASPAGDPFNFQLGLFAQGGYLYEGAVLRANLGMPVPPGFTTLLGTDSFYRQKLGSYAAYGQGTYTLAQGLRLTVGARLTHDTINMLYVTTAGGGVIPLLPVASPPAQDRSETNLSGRASLQYDVAPTWMLYGTVARGYKGPGYAQYSLDYVRPEIPTHFEIGSKAQFLDRKLTLNVAAYTTDFKDFQAQSVDVTTLTYKLQNAGKLRTRGFDVQLSARPTRQLTINAGLAYVDARYVTFTGDVCYFGQPTCVGGVSDSSGNRLPNAPKWKGVFDVAYEKELGEDLSALFNIGVKWQTKFNFQANADPMTVQPGYTTLDASIALSSKSLGGTLRAYCRNCTDSRFVSLIAGHSFLPGDYIQSLSPAGYRQVGLALDWRF